LNVVLDTHVLLWLALDAKRLSKRGRATIARAASRGGLAIASITLWEIAQLAARGRVVIQGTTSDWLAELVATTRVSVVELSPTIAELSTAFGPDFPRDLTDRIIAATSRAHAWPLVTADERIRGARSVQSIW